MSACATSTAAASEGDHAEQDVEQEPVELSEAYVHSLASLGLERLQNEPGRLHAEAIAVDEALHTLSLDHYRVFIQNQECVRHVRAQGKEMEGHLASLLTEVHGLGAEFSVFQREAAELVGGHKRNRQTLKHHMQARSLVELLEVPQLMDACVRSDLMEEALSIATFASTLERRHRSRRVVPSAPVGSVGGDTAAKDEPIEGHLPGVIKMIVEEVRESARGLQERLVAKLRGPIQLTSCLQVVSCLRRLEILALEEKTEKKKQRQRALARQEDVDVKGSPLKNSSGGGDGGSGSKREVTAMEAAKIRGGGVSQRQLALVEMKLQVDFLEARDAWLADAASRAGGHGGGVDLQQQQQQQALGAAANTASSGPYQTLMDLIESCRSQWFEVATQFRAIFLSVEGSGGGSATAARQSAVSSPRGGEDLATGSGRDSGDILSLWLLRRVSAFVEQLKGLLPLVEDGSLLRSLLEECMFFGASMGRLGTDFRGLLVPVFEERVSGAAAAQWATASAEFLVTLRDVAAIEAAGGNGASLLHVPDRSTIATSRGGPANGHGTSGAAAAAAEAERRAALCAGDGGIPPPPRSLMAFPPVARLLNLVLTSFNQLRECLPSSVEGRLGDALVLSFTDAFRGLAELKKTTLRANAAAASASPHNSGSPAAAGAGGSGPPSGRGGGAAAGTGGKLYLNTTFRALGLACDALAEQAVPHVALCFAALFGETPSAAANSDGGKAVTMGKRAEKLCARLLGSLESLGIYEPPPAPRPAVPSAPSTPTATTTTAQGAAGAVSPPASASSATAAAASLAALSTPLPPASPPAAGTAEDAAAAAAAVVVVADKEGGGGAAGEEVPLKSKAEELVEGREEPGAAALAGNPTRGEFGS
ncbi:unnamed protein product [Ectocarpus sp. CCAP 1310/34]|nr:unnamed protein product [Ectocarpus sp. CCAP 1310/34]